MAFRRQILHDHHEFLDLLRRQYGSRLIENKNLIIPVQHLKDLCPLLHSHRNVLDQSVRIYQQPVFFRQRKNLPARFIFLQQSALCCLYPQNNVVQNAETFYQFKMLVNHADSQFICVVGIIDRNLFSVFPDLTLLRLIQSEKHAHKR